VSDFRILLISFACELLQVALDARFLNCFLEFRTRACSFRPVVEIDDTEYNHVWRWDKDWVVDALDRVGDMAVGVFIGAREKGSFDVRGHVHWKVHATHGLTGSGAGREFGEREEAEEEEEVRTLVIHLEKHADRQGGV
jgi:hypothetical protein